MQMLRASVAVFLAAVTVVGCRHAPDVVIPEGIQTIKGILQPVPFSLKRRGTHALLGLDGKLVSYAESREVNLSTLEGREVTLTGVFEKNTDPLLPPVLIVQSVEGVAKEDVRPWIIPALGLSVDLPRSWKGEIRGKSAEFTASGSSVPILTITSRPEVSVPPHPLYGPLPTARSSSGGGETFVVGLRKATASVSDDKRSWNVAIEGRTSGGSEVTFSFALRSDLAAELQVNVFKGIVRTVEFHGSSAAASVRSAPSSRGFLSSDATGSRAAGEGAACGGTAGVLCPKGLYCRIMDSVTEIGVCVRR